MPCPPRFNSMAILVTFIGKILICMYNLPYKTYIRKSIELIAWILGSIWQYLKSINYSEHFFKIKYTCKAIFYIVSGNYYKISSMFAQIDQIEDDRVRTRKIDMTLFDDLRKLENEDSTVFVDQIVDDICNQVVQDCETMKVNDLNGWEAEIQELEKDSLQLDGVNESGYFEDEIIDSF